MKLFDIFLPGQDQKRDHYRQTQGDKPAHERWRGRCASGRNTYGEPISPDTWKIRVGNTVFSYDNDGSWNGFAPAPWKVTRVYSPSEANRAFPKGLQDGRFEDIVPFSYPVLELDGRMICTASAWMLPGTMEAEMKRFHGAGWRDAQAADSQRWGG